MHSVFFFHPNKIDSSLTFSRFAFNYQLKLVASCRSGFPCRTRKLTIHFFQEYHFVNICFFKKINIDVFFGIKEVVVPVLFQGRYLIITCLHCSLKTKIPNCRLPPCVKNKKTRSDGGSRQTAPTQNRGRKAIPPKEGGGKAHTQLNHTYPNHTNPQYSRHLPPSSCRSPNHTPQNHTFFLPPLLLPDHTRPKPHTPKPQTLNRTPLDHALLNQSLFFFFFRNFSKYFISF